MRYNSSPRCPYPVLGSERQSEELVHYLLQEFEETPEKIWESNIFGKSLHELVNEGLHNKLYRMPVDARMKMQETIERIINCRCIIELSQNAFSERRLSSFLCTRQSENATRFAQTCIFAGSRWDGVLCFWQFFRWEF